MMQCIAAGHHIVALANLRPDENKGKCVTVLDHSLNSCNLASVLQVGKKQSDASLVLSLYYMNATIEKMPLALLGVA